MDSKIQSNGGAQEAGRSSLHEVLACRQFEEEDREAIERVTMLLVEYAWSDDRMSDNAKKLKAAMLKVWEHWQARQANIQAQTRQEVTSIAIPTFAVAHG